jgi:hypothetical protein
MDLPPWTAEEIAAQAAKLGTELTLEAVTDLLAAVETIEPTLGRPSAPLTAAARRPDRSGRCGRLPTRRRAGRAMTDPLSLEAAEVLHAYRAGDTTPVEVLAAVRARIAAVNPVLNSVITVIGDRAAEESTRRWRAGAPRALEGITFGVKGVIDVEGVPTTAGSKNYDGRIAQRSVEVVRRAEEAGAIAVTKDAPTEFAIGGPQTRNSAPVPRCATRGTPRAGPVDPRPVQPPRSRRAASRSRSAPIADIAAEWRFSLGSPRFLRSAICGDAKDAAQSSRNLARPSMKQRPDLLSAPRTRSGGACDRSSPPRHGPGNAQASLWLLSQRCDRRLRLSGRFPGRHRS